MKTTHAPIETKRTTAIFGFQGRYLAKFLLLALLFDVALASRSTAEEVAVRLKSGRSFTAQISSRSNQAILWLRFGNRSTMILRPLSWSAITNASVDGRKVSLPELREIAANVDDDLALQRRSPTPMATQYRENDDATLSDSQKAQRWLGMAPPVKSVQFDTRLANWDADVESDGLIMNIQPLDASGRLVDARGVLTVELFGPREASFSEQPGAGGLPTLKLERWTIRLQAEQQDELGYTVRLPFRRSHPEFDSQLGSYGLVHVRLAAPGGGVFEASQDGVRLRAFAPTRDRLQLQTGRRFLATERTGR